MRRFGCIAADPSRGTGDDDEVDGAGGEEEEGEGNEG